MFERQSTINTENNDSMRLLMTAAILVLGAVLVNIGLILFRSGDASANVGYMLAGAAWLIFVARSIDVIRNAYVELLTPACRHLAVVPDLHLIDVAATSGLTVVKLVSLELNEPAAGMRGLAKRDVPPPLPFV